MLWAAARSKHPSWLARGDVSLCGRQVRANMQSGRGPHAAHWPRGVRSTWAPRWGAPGRFCGPRQVARHDLPGSPGQIYPIGKGPPHGPLAVWGALHLGTMVGRSRPLLRPAPSGASRSARVPRADLSNREGAPTRPTGRMGRSTWAPRWGAPGRFCGPRQVARHDLPGSPGQIYPIGKGPPCGPLAVWGAPPGYHGGALQAASAARAKWRVTICPGDPGRSIQSGRGPHAAYWPCGATPLFHFATVIGLCFPLFCDNMALG